MSACRCRAAAPSPSRRCSARFVPPRRQAAGAGQRRLWQAHGPDVRAITGRAVPSLETPEDQAVDPAALDAALAADPAITHVAAVQCETTSGILNPIEEIAEVVARHRPAAADRCHERLRRAAARCAAECRSTPSRPPPTNASRACPGSASSIVRDGGARARPRATRHSLSLDLHDQWAAWRRPANGASRRRPTCSPPSTRRWPSTRPRAASTAAAPAIATTAGSWSRACARWASRPCCPTPCRRRSSSPSACRPIRASSSRRFYDRLRDAAT